MTPPPPLFQVKQRVGAELIAAAEAAVSQSLRTALADAPGLVVLGQTPSAPLGASAADFPRLALVSFLVASPLPAATGRWLHHGFVCALLNDLFGIQARQTLQDAF